MLTISYIDLLNEPFFSHEDLKTKNIFKGLWLLNFIH